MAKFYTITFSIIFGMFLSIIPNVLNSSCKLAWDGRSVVAILIAILGVAASYCFGNIHAIIAKIKAKRDQ